MRKDPSTNISTACNLKKNKYSKILENKRADTWHYVLNNILLGKQERNPSNYERRLLYS